jgi:hypothetical protein
MAVTPPKSARPTAGSAILDAIRQHGPLTPGELRDLLAPIAPSTVKTSAMRLAMCGVLTRTPYTEPGGAATVQYDIGTVEYVARKPVHYDTDAAGDAWQPAPWVHPIRARALGLPVASR